MRDLYLEVFALKNIFDRVSSMHWFNFKCYFWLKYFHSVSINEMMLICDPPCFFVVFDVFLHVFIKILFLFLKYCFAVFNQVSFFCLWPGEFFLSLTRWVFSVFDQVSFFCLWPGEPLCPPGQGVSAGLWDLHGLWSRPQHRQGRKSFTVITIYKI